MAAQGHANGANGASASRHNDVDLDGLEYDPVQLEMMKEELIVVDYDDKPIGSESKKTCTRHIQHIITSVQGS